VHCSAIHHPIVGDPLYGGGRWSALSGSVADKVRHLLKGVKRQMLHARCLQFVHPATRKVIAFEAPVPEDMQRLMAGLATYSNAP
jgi:23S rRNA pseudouridine1911/1915/1917 synthase